LNRIIYNMWIMCSKYSVLVLGVLSLCSAVPKDLSFNEIRTALISIEGVTELHDLRLWSLTTNKPALSVHLAIGMSTYLLTYLICIYLLVSMAIGQGSSNAREKPENCPPQLWRSESITH